MYKVLEFFQLNPHENAIGAIKTFEEEFDVTRNTKVLRDEGTRAVEIKRQMRPLYGKRNEVDEKMRYLISDMEMEIYMAYPPRQGSEAQRDALRNKLKKENVDYLELKTQHTGLTMQIDELEDKYKDLEAEVKTARKMLDVYTSYLDFITSYMKGSK